MYINNIDFVNSKKTIEQIINVSQFKRAYELFDSLSGNITFKLTSGAWTNKPALNVLIYGTIRTLCQNCLNSINIDIKYTGIVPIFQTESELNDYLFGDNNNAPDGVVFDQEFDILQFIEDEVIMLLPLVPKHDKCIGILYSDNVDNPFKVLEQLI